MAAVSRAGAQDRGWRGPGARTPGSQGGGSRGSGLWGLREEGRGEVGGPGPAGLREEEEEAGPNSEQGISAYPGSVTN